MPDEGDGTRLGFNVTDTGIGISAELQGRLFNEVAQGDSLTGHDFGGSGLGLAITQRLVKLMEGQISVESRPEAGSKFLFDIKLRTVPDEVASPALAAPSVAEPPPEPTKPLTGLRVLLADDSATNRFVATRMLEGLGFHVDAVCHGGAAVQEVCRSHYDIVLMDMMMPEMDGLTATRLIRALPPDRANVPIIGLTANAMTTDEEACRLAGMDDFVTKPARAVDLEAVVRKAIARRAVTPEATTATDPDRCP